MTLLPEVKGEAKEGLGLGFWKLVLVAGLSLMHHGDLNEQGQGTDDNK